VNDAISGMKVWASASVVATRTRPERRASRPPTWRAIAANSASMRSADAIISAPSGVSW
jgi:hypothetical protein